MAYQLIQNENLDEAYASLSDDVLLGLDTETYGTEWSDRLFSLQISSGRDTFYFNFHDYRDHNVPTLQREVVFRKLADLFTDPSRVWFIHNAKFDLRRLSIEGIKIAGKVHCTQMCERFINNQYQRYSFAACLERRGLHKDDGVAKWLKENKTQDYSAAPFTLMFEYGCADAERVRILGMDQREKLIGEEYYLNDLELQKVAHEMEEIGICCDTEYAQKGFEYESQQQDLVRTQLSNLAGSTFRAGPTWLRQFFDRESVPYRSNPKTGNPIFNKSALDAIDHPAAALVRLYRKHEQYAGTYYGTYRNHPIVHAEIKLHGTDTGRFSYAEPNLQNVPKQEPPDPVKDPSGYKKWKEESLSVRKCFKPRTVDHVFVMLDYNQQEFRLLLDYAGEHALIRDILDNGADVHQATADAIGVTRKQAKTINFGLLYGMGAEKLAKALGVSRKEAQELIAQYFGRLPKVRRIINAIIDKSKRAGKIHTWCGRYLYTPPPMWIEEDGKKKRLSFDYAMPNHIIQGGCADVVRLAMVNSYRELEKYKRSNLLVQVHDELLFEVHKNELEVVDDLVRIMETTYRPFNGMKLTTGIEHSWKSWGKVDVEEGAPVADEKICSYLQGRGY